MSIAPDSPFNYQVTLAKVVFDKIIENKRPDIKIENCFNITGIDWIALLAKVVSTTEDVKISLSVDKSRLYTKPKRSDTSYLTIFAQCGRCRKTKKNNYKITMKLKPAEDCITVTFEVFREHNHLHQENQQIRGEERYCARGQKC